MRPSSQFAAVLAVFCLILASGSISRTDDGPWIDLSSLEAWKTPMDGWSAVGSAGLNPSKPKAFAVEPGSGVLYNGPTGKGSNLVSRQTFGDVEFHVEFNMPKGSNAGVKFQEVYEVQIFDSFGSTKPASGSDCGGVYPRSEEKPKYHHIDEGYPPLVNACKPPGEWQVLDVTFLTPRFDAAGKKVECAQITAVLNGKTVQDKLEVHSPTGGHWRDKEKTSGAILLQGDHGPVAFRNLKVRALPSKR